MAGLTQSSLRNQLLTCLSVGDFAYLAPHLRQVDLAVRSSIHSAGEAITEVFFPERGYASMLAALDEGDTAEVGMIGSEGMIGLPLVFGTDRSLVEAMVQGSGTGYSAGCGNFPARARREARFPSGPASICDGVQCAGDHDGGLQRQTPGGAAPRPMVTDGARPHRGRIRDDPRIPVRDARCASRRRHGGCRCPAERRLHSLRQRSHADCGPGRIGSRRLRMSRHRSA